MKRILQLVLLVSGLAASTQGAVAAEQVTLQWFGQSAVKLTSPGGKVIVIDPFLTRDPATPKRYKDLKALGKVDLILVTHAHADHFGDTATFP